MCQRGSLWKQMQQLLSWPDQPRIWLISWPFRNSLMPNSPSMTPPSCLQTVVAIVRSATPVQCYHTSSPTSNLLAFKIPTSVEYIVVFSGWLVALYSVILLSMIAYHLLSPYQLHITFKIFSLYVLRSSTRTLAKVSKFFSRVAVLYIKLENYGKFDQLTCQHYSTFSPTFSINISSLVSSLGSCSCPPSLKFPERKRLWGLLPSVNQTCVNLLYKTIILTFTFRRLI